MISKLIHRLKKFRRFRILKSLARRPRGPGRIRYAGMDLEYTDSLSLYGELLDIFEEGIYHFYTDEPNPRIIDGGACIGVSAIDFKRKRPGARVISFEPDPAMFAVLQRNLERNGFADVEAVNAGLGAKEGSIRFYADGSDGGSAVARTGGREIDVQIHRLSDYLKEPTQLLKMNIEGMEGEVFEEIQEQLHNVEQIIFEYHCFSELPQTLGRILQILDERGFRYVVTDATNAKVPIPFSMPEDYRFFNLVYAVRRK